MDMKIAIPVSGGKLASHFGHCEQFAFVEVDKEGGRVVATELLDPPPHAPGVMPRWAAEQGANLIIAGGMGMRAKELFEAAGVEVLVGAGPQTPAEIVDAYLAGTLQVGGNACDH
jgi:predicted Fe-Mo cluster-binding NifX family protein